MGRYTLDKRHPPALPRAERAGLDAMTDDRITAAASSDPDNPPMTDDELARLTTARTVQKVRARTGLSQSRFAATYRINLARLRDLEQGRTQPDSALLAYLAVIGQEPDVVKRVLSTPETVAA
jgi:putative transcriptional regulator